MQRVAVRSVTRPAVMVAVLIVLGLFPGIPVGLLPLPIVLQNLGVMLAGEILGAKQGTLAVACLLLLVAVGLPVLSGGSGGITCFVGPSAGALWAWLVTPWLIGRALERPWWRQAAWREWLLVVLIGVIGINLAAVAWLVGVYHLRWWATLLAEAVYLPGDLVKATVSVLVARRLRRAGGWTQW